MRFTFPFKFKEGDSVEVCEFAEDTYDDPTIKGETKWTKGTVVKAKRTCIGGVPTDDKIYTVMLYSPTLKMDIVRDKREHEMRLTTIGYMRRKKNARQDG